MSNSKIQITLSILHDIIAIIISFFIALQIKVGGGLIEISGKFWFEAIIYLAVFLGSLAYFGVFRAIWKHTFLSDVLLIIKSVTISILIFTVIIFLVTRLDSYHRSTLIINWAIAIFALSFFRVLSRIYYEGRDWAQSNINAIPVIICCNIDISNHLLRSIAQGKNKKYNILAIFDPNNHGRKIYHLPIIGKIKSLQRKIDKLANSETMPQKILMIEGNNLSDEEVGMLLKLANDNNIKVSKLANIDGLEELSAANIKPVKIEDLLCRNQHKIDYLEIAKLVTNRKILITGAGGTIGSELTRQVINLNPAKLCLIDNSEFALYKIDHECGAKWSNIKREAQIADIRDKARVNRIFAEFKPDIVIHAAALKHVPLLEEHYDEAVLTNVVGTKNIVDAASKYQAKICLMISTDKAINPTNFMGATKRLAELYCQSFEKEKDNKTNFVVVRFGNVLGSNGSVVPLFTNQIKNGGPVTLTHADITRYFMTVKEAVGLVLQATNLSYQKKDSNVYVLDMGKPIKIVDLAKQMIMLAGFIPEQDIKIEVVGLRPGEKLHEELFYDFEDLGKTSHKGIFLANPRREDRKLLAPKIEKLYKAAQKGDEKECYKLLRALVHSYKPTKEE